MTKRKIIMIIGVVLSVFLLICSSSYAYEKTRMGREVIGRIDKSNADEYKEFLTKGQYYRIKNWDVVFEIVPTVTDFKPSPGYIEATKKYKGTVKLDDEANLLNYKAGCPFPDPKNGTEVAWNFYWRYYGDDRFYTSFTGYILDKNMQQRINRSYTRQLRFTGRVDLDPKPVIPNDEGIEYKDVLMQRFPFEVKGLGMLTIRYSDPNKDDDLWTYVPAMRRIRRMSTAQRSDTWGGTDTTWDDVYIWSGRTQTQIYKLIGKGEVYHVRHEPKEIFPELSKKFPCVAGGYYEKVPAYIVECIPKDPNYIYSKRVWWIDPMYWDIAVCDIYDRKNRLWKSITMRMFTEGDLHHSHTMEFCDYINIHGTIWHSYGFKKNQGLPEKDFTLSSLEKFAR